jgi:hypothetical protein
MEDSKEKDYSVNHISAKQFKDHSAYINELNNLLIIAITDDTKNLILEHMNQDITEFNKSLGARVIRKINRLIENDASEEFKRELINNLFPIY